MTTMATVASLTHVRAMVDLTLPAQLQTSTKFKKNLALILLISVFRTSDFIICQNVCSIRIWLSNFTYSKPFIEMFMFIRKSRYLYRCFYWRRLNVKYLTQKQTVFYLLKQHFFNYKKWDSRNLEYLVQL